MRREGVEAEGAEGRGCRRVVIAWTLGGGGVDVSPGMTTKRERESMVGRR